MRAARCSGAFGEGAWLASQSWSISPRTSSDADRGEHEFELADESVVLGVSPHELTAMIIRSEAPR